MTSAKEYCQTAGSIADETIAHAIHGDLLTIQWSSADIARIKAQIALAHNEEPDNPHYQYILACLTIAQGHQATGLEMIRALADTYPQYSEAQGYNAHPNRWFSPFHYPAWHEQMTMLPDHFQRLPQGGTLLVSMRDCCQRVVSFFRHCEPGYCTLTKKTPVDVDIQLLDTPHGLIAGVYLVINPGKQSGRISETIIQCDAVPPSLQDMSACGYWLLQLLASQSYTFIILHDTESGTVYHKKHYFNASQKRTLAAIRGRLDSVSMRTDWNRESFIQAQQYYMKHVRIDDMLG